MYEDDDKREAEEATQKAAQQRKNKVIAAAAAFGVTGIIAAIGGHTYQRSIEKNTPANIKSKSQDSEIRSALKGKLDTLLLELDAIVLAFESDKNAKTAEKREPLANAWRELQASIHDAHDYLDGKTDSVSAFQPEVLRVKLGNILNSTTSATAEYAKSMNNTRGDELEKALENAVPLMHAAGSMLNDLKRSSPTHSR